MIKQMIRKEIIITGGHSGIGLELSKILITEGHKLGLIVRNENRKNDFLRGLPGHATENVDFFFADLSNQKNVFDLANEIKTKWNKVDVLFNNAGVLLKEKKFSTQQNEMQYEVNTLAPYMVTTLLKPLLEKSDGAVVVNTVTDGLNYPKAINIKELLNPTGSRKIFGPYMQSKLALALIMNKLSEEFKKNNIRIVNVSPGGNKTKMTTGDEMPNWLTPIVYLFYKKPEKGARLLYDAAFKKDYKDKTGFYLQKNKIEKLKASISEEQKEELLKGLNTGFQ
jgi:NAD(P)-dependent dehydrogenase (short-subunit alcohol dehydrogenase family)